MIKQKIIALIIVLNIMMAALTGCGSKQAVDQTEGPAIPTEASNEESDNTDGNDDEYVPPAKADYEEEITTVDEETMTDEDIEKILEGLSDEELAEVVRTGEIPEYATESIGPTAEADDIEGIVVLNVLPGQYFTDDDEGYDIYSVQNINPDSGEVKEISRFCVLSSYTGHVRIPENAICARIDHLCLRSLFSPDYGKMAVEQLISARGEVYNTGWIDQYGNFTDVAARTGNASTDFNIRSFKTLGFMPDGTFTYRERGNSMDVLYPVYSTDSETLSMAVEEDPWPKFYMCNQNYTVMGHEGQDESILWFNHYTLTDWINDTECIADTGRLVDSVIVNTQTQEVTEYIPDTSVDRTNWSGVASPDGSEIAFLSMTTRGTDAPCIYVVPREGGEPVKISCDINFSRTSATMCGILEWK